MQDALVGAYGWRAATACALLSSFALYSPSVNATQVTGSLGAPVGSGVFPQISFTCSLNGQTCTGFFSSADRDDGCSNSKSFTGPLTLNGLDLSKPGPIQGTVTHSNDNFVNTVHNADGTCVYTLNPTPSTRTSPFSGTWNGTTGSLTITEDHNGVPETLAGSFTADVPGPNPIFPMTVTSSIDANVANAAATIQFRPQDVGTTASVYVFAIAPAPVVHASRAAKDTPAPVTCVLSQVNPSGQLQGASASALQASVTGVLSAQGQAVTLLNNVPTSNVVGATTYVGYGATSSAMIANGTYRAAVTVPGAVECPGGTVSYEGLWLKPDESGWGLNLTHQGTILFGTWFTYDTDGSGMWLVMSNGSQASPGTFSGTLYRTVGPPFSATSFNSIAFPDNYTQVGTLTLSFIDANTGTMSYTVNGVSQSKPITRFIYAAGGTNCVLGATQGASPNYQDLWLHSPLGTESGWGVNLTHQGDILFATWFTYQAGATQTNKGLWLVMSNGNKTAPGVYTGALQTTTGPAFSAQPFNAGSVARTTVGSGTFTFTDANTGTFSYTVNGVSQSKAIARYIYSSPTTVCQ